MCKQLDQTMYVSQHASKPDGTAETAPVVPESVTPPPIANPKLVLQQPLAPPARRATARRRDRRRGQSGLTPAWPGSRCVLASPDAPPAHAVPHAHRPTQAHAPRPAHTRLALGAALALHSRARRAPVGRCARVFLCTADLRTLKAVFLLTLSPAAVKYWTLAQAF